jgi:hypothetical protein
MQACDSDRHALANIKSLDSDLDPGRMAGPASGVFCGREWDYVP